MVLGFSTRHNEMRHTPNVCVKSEHTLDAH